MLISVAEIKAIYDIEGADEDGQLVEIIKAVDAQIKEFCGRNFESEARTEYYDGDGTDTLIVKEYPITAISSIYDDVDRVYGADTAIDTSDLIYGETGGVDAGIIVYDGSVFCTGKNNIKITYTAGYAAGDIPKDLKLAAMKLVVAEHLESSGAIFAIAPEGADGVSTDRPGRLRSQAWKVIKRYRRLRI